MDWNEAKDLTLFEAVAAHLGELADADLLAQMAATGRDKKRRFRGSVRRAVIARDGRVCFYCDGAIVGAVHIDHVLPHSKGGRTVEANGVAACAPCNLKKGARVW